MKRKHTLDRHETQAPVRRRHPSRSRRNRRRRQRVPRLAWLLAILIAEVIFVAVSDPRFNVTRIDVRGNKVLTADQVKRRSGLACGGNLFRAPLKAARRRLLEVPAAADVSLHRRPPGRIVIRVRERQPFACVAARNALVTVDSQGVAFRVDRAPPPRLPLVNGLESIRLKPGASLPPALARALRECVEAARTPPGHEIARISIDQNANLCFNSTDTGYQVRLGPPERLREKFALLTALENSLPDLRRDCEYIDLSCLEAPAWKPKPANLAGRANPGNPNGPGMMEASPHDRGRLTQD